MQKKKKRHFYIWVLLLLIAVILGAWKWKLLNTWEFRSALPSSAKDIHEWFREDGVLPDYTYHLKAEIDEAQFLKYVEAFHMTPHIDGRKYEDDMLWLNWKRSPGFEETWWSPTDSLSETYVSQIGHEWVFAKYENGYIYVKGINH